MKSAFFPNTSRKVPGCALTVEHLENRFALSTLLGGVIESPPLDSTSVTQESAPVADPLPADPPPTDPLPVDPPPIITDPPNLAPVIHDFALTIVNNWCTLSGWVSDDQDPTGYHVLLTGVINESIQVDNNDHFSFGFAYDPVLHGAIYAITQDLLGVLSNEPFVNV
jgi:hypothetical protein